MVVDAQNGFGIGSNRSKIGWKWSEMVVRFESWWYNIKNWSKLVRNGRYILQKCGQTDQKWIKKWLYMVEIGQNGFRIG